MFPSIAPLFHCEMYRLCQATLANMSTIFIASWVDKREAEAVAHNKRAAFEGPRGHRFPHFYPASSPYGSVVPSSTGAACPSGTGAPSSTSSAYGGPGPSSTGAPYPSGTGAPSKTGTASVGPYPTAPISSSSASWQEPYPSSYP